MICDKNDICHPEPIRGQIVKCDRWTKDLQRCIRGNLCIFTSFHSMAQMYHLNQTKNNLHTKTEDGDDDDDGVLHKVDVGG